MDNPGLYSLGDATITSAGTQTFSAVDVDLSGISSLSAQFRFAPTGGGTSVKVYLQTSLDGGTTWVDIACVAFTTSAGVKAVNLNAGTPKTTPVTPTDGTLTDDTCVDGLIGTLVRQKVVSVGTYTANTLMSGRIVAR